MVFLLVFLIFIVIVAGMWFLGTWNVFINLVITILAGTIASSYFEVVEAERDRLTARRSENGPHSCQEEVAGCHYNESLAICLAFCQQCPQLHDLQQA